MDISSEEKYRSAQAALELARSDRDIALRALAAAQLRAAETGLALKDAERVAREARREKVSDERAERRDAAAEQRERDRAARVERTASLRQKERVERERLRAERDARRAREKQQAADAREARRAREEADCERQAYNDRMSARKQWILTARTYPPPMGQLERDEIRASMESDKVLCERYHLTPEIIRSIRGYQHDYYRATDHLSQTERILWEEERRDAAELARMQQEQQQQCPTTNSSAPSPQ